MRQMKKKKKKHLLHKYIYILDAWVWTRAFVDMDIEYIQTAYKNKRFYENPRSQSYI